LNDLGESGMSFEFAEAPPLRQRIDFKFETMGCTTAHLGGQHFNDSFGLAGEVVWTRQFERAAGVRFLDPPEMGRKHIQNLLHSESTASAPTTDEATSSEVLVPESESAESPACATKALCEGEGDGTPGGTEPAESSGPLGQELDSEQIRKILEAPTFEAYKELLIDEPTRSSAPLDSKSRVVRIALIAVLGLLAILATVAAAMRIPARWVRRAQAADQVASLPTVPARPVGSESRSAVISAQPFIVEVSDANNKKWLLQFDRNLPKSLPMTVANKSATPSSPSDPKKKSAVREEPSAIEKRDGLQGRRLVKPQLSRPAINAPARHLSADIPPVIPDVVVAPPIDSAAGILTTAEVPAPLVRSSSPGGMVQPARLLKSAPPTYPELARSTHVTGDVILDALIDADGNVRNVKTVSGPVLLQQAAKDAVRQWKYDPARLDGRPVAMHLSVTVKFSPK
jgi:TonB family protein